MTNQQAQRKAQALKIASEVILECIQEAGEKGIPSGHLYAMLISHINMQLETYQLIIDHLKQTGKITETHFLLKAVTETKNV